MSTFSALATASKDPRDAHLVIRQIIPGMITFSQPFARFGTIPIGGRSTAISLGDKGVFVYVSHPYTEATEQALKELGGEVKWLVTPDGEHGINIKAWADKFPNAQAIGVSRFAEEKPDVKWAGLFGSGGENKTYGFEPEITLHQVSAHRNHELTAIHHPSGTLLEADLLFNLPPTEQYSRAGGIPFWFSWIAGTMSPGGRVQNGIAKGLEAKPQAKEELAPIAAAKWDRIIPCHGEVIETGGKAVWEKVFGRFSTASNPPTDDPARL